MKNLQLRLIFGAFAMLRRRSAEVGQPGLITWAEAGETAARDMSAQVVKAAHASEITDLEAAREIAAAVAGLADGRIDSDDLAHLARAARLANRSAELDHDIGEVVASS